MASVPSARKRDASASFATSAGSSGDGGAISGQLNDFARAYAQVYPGDTSGTADVPYGAIANQLGQLQANCFNQSNSKFKASINDGGGSITFEGFEVEPNIQISTGNFSPQIQAVHSTALIQRLNMSLYAKSVPDLGNIKDEDIIKRISDVLKLLVSNWRLNFYPSGYNETEKAVADEIHSQNIVPLQILQNILTSSRSFKMAGLATVAAKLESINVAINNWIIECLTDSADNFWSSFLTLIQSFGLLYAPSWGAGKSNGFLFSPRDAFAALQSKGDIDGLSFQPTLRLPEVPITYVIMTGLPFNGPNRTYASNSKLLPGQMVPSTLKYPQGQNTGRAYMVPQPPFVTGSLSSLGSLNRPVTYGANMEPGKAVDIAKALAQNFITQTDALRTFLLDYLRNTLHTLQLQGSSVSIMTALDTSWTPGKAYEVSMGGQVLFRGILASAVHNISSSPDSPQASSSLGFSYVQWGGFRLSFA